MWNAEYPANDDFNASEFERKRRILRKLTGIGILAAAIIAFVAMLVFWK